MYVLCLVCTLFPVCLIKSLPSVFRWVRVARSLVFCGVFCGSLFVLFLLTIVLSSLIYTSDYPFVIFKLLAIVLSVFLWFTASDYPVGIFKLLAIVLSVCVWFTLLITPLVSSNFWPLYCLFFFDLRLWLPRWYLQSFLNTLFILPYYNDLYRFLFQKSDTTVYKTAWPSPIHFYLSGCV